MSTGDLGISEAALATGGKPAQIYYDKSLTPDEKIEQLRKLKSTGQVRGYIATLYMLKEQKEMRSGGDSRLHSGPQEPAAGSGASENPESPGGPASDLQGAGNDGAGGGVL